jgi:septum formation topological specificity factor MinE
LRECAEEKRKRRKSACRPSQARPDLKARLQVIIFFTPFSLKRHKSRLDLKARLDVIFQRKGGGAKKKQK